MVVFDALAEGLTTPHLFDACLRVGVTPRAAAPGTRPLQSGSAVSGPALPVQHFGSVDVFLEVVQDAPEGAIMLIDNGGRTDEACVGDLTALEAQAHGCAGMVVWGAHRDTADLQAIGFPVWSLGAYPCGPTRLDERTEDALTVANLPSGAVTRDDYVVADDDGVLILPTSRLDAIVVAAVNIRDTERGQAVAVATGHTLSQQLDVPGFLTAKEENPDLTFREHLRARGGSIEE